LNGAPSLHSPVTKTKQEGNKAPQVHVLFKSVQKQYDKTIPLEVCLRSLILGASLENQNASWIRHLQHQSVPTLFGLQEDHLLQSNFDAASKG
jgi:hypothetical protein